MTTQRLRRPDWAGFTLIELLIVVSLMGVLAALAAGAFFRVRAVQMKSSSDATLTKLNTALDNRWKAIQESVKSDHKNNGGQWTNALAAANGDPDVAESLLMYAKVKNELPMTFAEAKSATIITTSKGTITLPAKATFAALPSGGGSPEESAICFYVAVTTSGGGGAMLDQEGLQQQVGESAGQKYFKDAWDKPIAFVRHVFTPELDQAPFVLATAANKDPFDPTPKGKLTGFMAVNPGVWSNITLNAPGFAMIPGNYQSRNHVPTLISAGPDKEYFTTTYTIFGGPENDNLLSYRLRRQGSKGD